MGEMSHCSIAATEANKWRTCYTPSVAGVCVEITGRDGKKHILTTDATSAYDAVEKAVEAWNVLWWWDADTIAIARRNDESWNIPIGASLSEGQDRNGDHGRLPKTREMSPGRAPNACLRHAFLPFWRL